LATEKLSVQLREPVLGTLHAFGNFVSDPQRAAQEVKDRMGQIGRLDPGLGHPERRVWARILGALAEIDIYLAHHPRLLKLEEIT
jgi:hypothetical protein